MRDGSLLRWTPNQEPDPLVVAMNKLSVSTKAVPKVLTFDEEIEQLVKDYEEYVKTSTGKYKKLRQWSSYFNCR